MKKITPNTSAADLEARVTAGGHSNTPPWQSDSQRTYLERLARSVLRDARGGSVRQSEIEVQFTSDKVACKPKPDGGYIIYISATADPQHVTDLPKECWELLRQEVELFHELGHVLYTDWDQFETRLEDIESGWERSFDRVNNAAEDGAIELLIKREYDISDDLDVYHANRVAIADQRLAAKATERAVPPVAGRLMGGAAAGIAVAEEIADKDTRFVPWMSAANQLTQGAAAARTVAEEIADNDPRFTPAASKLPSGSAEQIATGQPIRVYTVLEGVMCGLLDMGRFDSGRFATLIDPEDTRRQVRNQRVDILRDLQPRMEALMQDMLTEPDGAARADLTYEFWQDLKPKLEEMSEPNTEVDVNPTGRPDDADTHVVSGTIPADALDEGEGADTHVRIQDPSRTRDNGQGGAPEETDEPEGCADDTSSATPPADSTATAFDESQADVPDATVVGGKQDADKPTSPTDTDEDSDGTASEAAGEASEIGPELDLDVDAEQLRDKYGSPQTESEPREDPLADDLDDITAALADEDIVVDELGVVEPEEQLWDRDRWERATRVGQTLASDLRAQLQEHRTSEIQPGHRSGRIDSQRLYGAETGTSRIFQQVDESDEKDYSCQIVLDRSGSMNGDRIEAAEEATGQLFYALEAVGVDVSVLSMYANRPWLEVPFGADPAAYASALMTNRSSGATPLSVLLELARERIHTGDGEHPLVIVITDGVPDNEQAYRDALAACNFDVYGVYIDESAGVEESRDHIQDFDRLVYSAPGDVAQRLRTLVNEIVY